MAGLRGNNAYIAFARQAAKGTAATVRAPTSTKLVEGKEEQGVFKSPFSGGNIEPKREFGKLAETDASRNIGVSYAKVGGIAGSPEMYVREDTAGALIYAVLGADAIKENTAPKFEHTITPNATIPYYTFWKMQSNTLWERYTDCFVSSLQIKTSAGEPLVATANVLGLKATKLGSEPLVEGTIPLDKKLVYNMNNAKTVKLGSGSAVHTVSSFDITYNNGVTLQQTDSFTPYDVVPGIFSVDVTFDLIFETLVEYEEYVYGESKPGAEIVGESNKLFQQEVAFKFETETNHFLKFNVQKLAYETFVIQPNVTGAPIVVSVKGVGQRVSSGNLCEVVLENEVNTY